VIKPIIYKGKFDYYINSSTKFSLTLPLPIHGEQKEKNTMDQYFKPLLGKKSHCPLVKPPTNKNLIDIFQGCSIVNWTLSNGLNPLNP
jgi:hypothetical protein